jgi:hypothetical protein
MHVKGLACLWGCLKGLYAERVKDALCCGDIEEDTVPQAEPDLKTDVDKLGEPASMKVSALMTGCCDCVRKYCVKPVFLEM